MLKDMGITEIAKLKDSTPNLRINKDYSYEDREIGQVNNLDTNLPSYWLVNACASLFSEDDWEATSWVDNVQDKRYLNFHGQFNQSVGKSYGMPRTYGLRLTKDF